MSFLGRILIGFFFLFQKLAQPSFICFFFFLKKRPNIRFNQEQVQTTTFISSHTNRYSLLRFSTYIGYCWQYHTTLDRKFTSWFSSWKSLLAIPYLMFGMVRYGYVLTPPSLSTGKTLSQSYPKFIFRPSTVYQQPISLKIGDI